MGGGAWGDEQLTRINVTVAIHTYINHGRSSLSQQRPHRLASDILHVACHCFAVTVYYSRVTVSSVGTSSCHLMFLC